MYNVQFGESILLTEERQTPFLIDFGSDMFNTLPDVSKEIKSHCTDGLDLLISHFHSDHINGILNTDLFSSIAGGVVYIPDLFAMQNVSSRLDFLQIETLIDFLNALGHSTTFKSRLYELLCKIKSSKRSVQFLKRGKEFSACGVDCQVLWPCFDTIKVNSKTVTHTISLLRKLGLISANIKDVSTDRIPLETIDEFNQMLQQAFEKSPDISPELQDNLETLNNKLIVKVKSLSASLSDSDRHEICERINALIKQGNRISIVFQDKANHGVSRFLFTGDFEKSDYKHISQKNSTPALSQSYTLVKAPHHGTVSHFIHTLPPCKHIIISNGACRGNYGKIHWGYSALYWSNRGTSEIHCTNKRCEICDSALLNHPCIKCPGHMTMLSPPDYIDISV
jgi:beta-lactamase superfamily II metal-dependent hydrolase